ncbi:STAS domain-containing protein [Nonomuraea insulae]|uniref:Anti-sigma factor antagonist n=1 Tax=Nonomuraea insulae TaxID=1616787 RepID=A0ABW1CW34_9ACTN
MSDIAAATPQAWAAAQTLGKSGAMTELSIDVQRLPGCHVVHLEGEVDRTTQQPLAQTFSRLLQADPPPKIVVDVTDLAFCDSGGLWTLIGSQRRAEERGGALRLIGVHGALARLLTITQLVHLFPPYRSLAQASTWARPGGQSR